MADTLPFVHDLTPAELRALQLNGASAQGLEAHFQDRLQDGSAGPALAFIPAGAFAMGNTDPGRDFGELPPRHLTLPAYAIGCFCVTAAEFDRFTQDTGFIWADHLLRTTGRQPVTNIDRHDAAAYLAWLSDQTGATYRLPSEAEWEYAARAGSASAYCVGDELGCSAGNTGSFRLQGRSAQGWKRFLPFCMPANQAIDVGCYPPNLWGLYDMHGNVWEFTEDVWQGGIDAAHRNKPVKPGTWFVTKGGSWFEPAWQARSAARKPRRIDELDTNLGFRVLRELSAAP